MCEHILNDNHVLDTRDHRRAFVNITTQRYLLTHTHITEAQFLGHRYYPIMATNKYVHVSNVYQIFTDHLGVGGMHFLFVIIIVILLVFLLYYLD